MHVHVTCVHVPACTWGIWHIVNHIEETHMESHKKNWVNSVNGSHRNSTLKLFLSCSWRRGQTNKQDKTRRDKTSEATSRTRAPSGALVENGHQGYFFLQFLGTKMPLRKAHVARQRQNVAPGVSRGACSCLWTTGIFVPKNGQKNDPADHFFVCIDYNIDTMFFTQKNRPKNCLEQRKLIHKSWKTKKMTYFFTKHFFLNFTKMLQTSFFYGVVAIYTRSTPPKIS